MTQRESEGERGKEVERKGSDYKPPNPFCLNNSVLQRRLCLHYPSHPDCQDTRGLWPELPDILKPITQNVISVNIIPAIVQFVTSETQRRLLLTIYLPFED